MSDAPDLPKVDSDQVRPFTEAQMSLPQYDAYPLPPGPGNAAIQGEKQADVLGGVLLKDAKYLEYQQKDTELLKGINANSNGDTTAVANYLLAVNRADRIKTASLDWDIYLDNNKIKPDQLTGDNQKNYASMQQIQSQFDKDPASGTKTDLKTAQEELIRVSGGKITADQLTLFQVNRLLLADRGQEVLVAQKPEAIQAAAPAQSTEAQTPAVTANPATTAQPAEVTTTPTRPDHPPHQPVEHAEHQRHHDHPGIHHRRDELVRIPPAVVPPAEVTATPTRADHPPQTNPVEHHHAGTRHGAEHTGQWRGQGDTEAEDLNRQELQRILGQKQGVQQQPREVQAPQTQVGQPTQLAQPTDQWAGNLSAWEQRNLGHVNTGLSDQERYKQDYEAWQARYGGQQRSTATPGYQQSYNQTTVNPNNGYYNGNTNYSGNYNQYGNNGYNGGYYNGGYNSGYSPYQNTGLFGTGLFGGGFPPISIGFSFGPRPWYYHRRYY